MKKKVHPADVAAEAQMIAAIRTADHFLASLFCGYGRYDKTEASTVLSVLSAGARMEVDARGTQRCIFYAVGADGRATMLTRDLIDRLLKSQRCKGGTMTNDAGEDIPDFLKIPQEERRAAWDKTTPKGRSASKQEEPAMPRKTNGTTKATARKPIAKTPTPAKEGTRSRYDWAGAEELAAKGKMPPPLDFSAPTHARFRDALAEVVKAAKGKDAKTLAAIKINPVSSSPKALDRYRELCLKALKAKAA